MSHPSVTAPAAVGGRWEAVKFDACPYGKRVIDVNHERREVRWSCKMCKRTHVVKVGTGA